MLNKLLKVKHWQLFIFVVGLPLIMQMVFMASIFNQIANNKVPDPFFVFSVIPYVFSFALLIMIVLFGWYFAIVIKMDRLIPTSLKLNMLRFKIFLFIPLVYFVVLFSLVIIMTNQLNVPRPAQDIRPIVSIIFIIIPLHLFSIFRIGHTFYCVGKSIKLAELKRPVKFEDYAAEFFLARFYPIGFWILQPKLNKLVNEEPNLEIKSESNSDIL